MIGWIEIQKKYEVRAKERKIETMKWTNGVNYVQCTNAVPLSFHIRNNIKLIDIGLQAPIEV